MVLADDGSPTFMCGGFECVLAMCMDVDRVQKAVVDGTASAGTNTIRACSRAPSASFVLATTHEPEDDFLSGLRGLTFERAPSRSRSRFL